MPHGQFRERLLSVMDRKHHWAWPSFSGPGMGREQLKVHFQHEFATYVRDFPVLLARIHAKNPPAPVRRMLAENIYEEDTGGLSFGKSHAELFLAMMQGFGFDAADFDDVRLLPAARAYRGWLDRVTRGRDWVLAAATMAIFVEGSVNDRREIENSAAPKTEREIEEIVRNHPLVRYHGVSPDCMTLTRAHQKVEGGHRHDAYAMVMAGAKDRPHQQAVIECVEKALALWLRYRDAVAGACGLAR
jgi:pyrroloquinoline-quinone synthase